MKKPSKKWTASMATLAMLTVSLSFGVRASGYIYDDDNVSITSAVDRYIASNSDAPIVEDATATDIPDESKITVGKISVNKQVLTASEEETKEQPKSTAKYPLYENMAIVKIDDSVNIREEGNINAKRVGSIAPKGILVVKEKGTEWSLVESGGVTGYIKNEFLAFGDDAGKYAEENNIDYYTDTVRATVVSDSTSTSSGSSSQSTSSQPQGIVTPPSGTGGQDVVNYALQFEGNPYQYGGTSLTNGADCSGFVMTVYADCGYSLPRTAGSQAGVGTPVSLDAVYPGDLIFYDHGTGEIEHVGIYIGNGQIIHASTSRTGIIVADMYYSTPCYAVRIIP